MLAGSPTLSLALEALLTLACVKAAFTNVGDTSTGSPASSCCSRGGLRADAEPSELAPSDVCPSEQSSVEVVARLPNTLVEGYLESCLRWSTSARSELSPSLSRTSLVHCTPFSRSRAVTPTSISSGIAPASASSPLMLPASDPDLTSESVLFVKATLWGDPARLSVPSSASQSGWRSNIRSSGMLSPQVSTR
eukprot:scaffold495_cov243-Pinguiococcus_pyrenoidosus.AAC.39